MIVNIFMSNTHNSVNSHEVRIDVTKQTAEELALAGRQAQLIFKFNHTMLGTPEYDELMHRIFPSMGSGSLVSAPLTAVRPHNVTIGRNVVVMPGCLMMSAGGITIGDGTMIAANVQLISNNHDLYERHIITCKPVRIGKNAWIGAGATILPGVTIGENAVVGAGSIVTRDVEADTIVAGNPARFIKRIPQHPECAAMPDPDEELQQLGLDSCGD